MAVLIMLIRIMTLVMVIVAAVIGVERFAVMGTMMTGFQQLLDQFL